MERFGLIHNNKSQCFEKIRKRLYSSPNVYILGEAQHLGAFLEIIPKRTMLDYLLIETPLKINEQLYAQLKVLRKRQANTEIILFGPDCTVKTLLTLLKTGISGYILTENNADFFMDLLTRKESLFFSPEILKKLVHHHRPSIHEESNTVEKLTPRQLDILKLLANGQTYENIASILNISINGVKFHLKAIYSKFEVDNRIQAIKYYENNFTDFLS
jgi:NarL family two-component system response regulator LiaR